MKKLLAILLPLCMLLSLGACGGDDDDGGYVSDTGVTIVNGLDCAIEDIYIVPMDAESWGEDAVGYLGTGVGGFWYPQDAMGASDVEVDIMVVDEFDNTYIFYGVNLADGEYCTIAREDDGSVSFSEQESGYFYTAEVDEGTSGAAIYNELDVDISELGLIAGNGDNRIDVTVYDILSGDCYEFSVTDDFGSPKAIVDITIVDTYGDEYLFSGVEIREGSEYAFRSSDFGPVLANDNFGQEWSSEHTVSADRGLSQLEGVWESAWDEAYVLFYGDMTWEAVSYDARILPGGEYEFYGREVVINYEGDSYTFLWNSDTELYCEDDDATLTRCFDFYGQEYEDFRNYVQSQQAAFPQMGLQVNYEFGEGGVYMDNGACVFANDGQYYERMPIYVSIEQNSFNDTLDGFIETEFTVTYFLDNADYPQFKNQVLTYSQNVSHILCDYYTGYALPTSVAYGVTSRGDNYYYYEYESQGRTVCVDYCFSTDWSQEETGLLIYVSVFIRMPADYDGLVFSILEAEEDYLGYITNREADIEMYPITAGNLENALICCVNPQG